MEDAVCMVQNCTLLLRDGHEFFCFVFVILQSIDSLPSLWRPKVQNALVKMFWFCRMYSKFFLGRPIDLVQRCKTNQKPKAIR